MNMDYEVTVDGRKFRVRFFERDGVPFVEHEGGTFPVRAETPLRSKVQQAQVNGGPVRFGYQRGKETVSVVLDGAVYEATVSEAEHARLSQLSRRRAGTGAFEVKAPMPGLVVALRVNVGDKVKKGQSLLGLHAMKLENDIRSPRDGVVKAIAVKAGDVLEKGATMVKLAPLPQGEA